MIRDHSSIQSFRLFSESVGAVMRSRCHSIVLCLVFSLLVNSADGGNAINITGETMGTYYSIVLDSPPADLNAKQLQKKIESRLNDINQQMSTWESESEISRFNESLTTDWFTVSAEFANVAGEARRIYELTDGAFDPTVEPLIKLWGFGDHRTKTVPDATDIKQALQSTGMQHLSIRSDPPALKKDIGSLSLNLSAIAKGHAVDAIAKLLVAENLPAFVVDIGGENRAGLAKASGDPWRIGVESPVDSSLQVIPLVQSAIATSGDYRNAFNADGVSYSHVINPVTGWPMKDPPASVSVIADSCMTADAWATAMMILGVEKGTQIAKANSLSVMFQEVAADKTIRKTGTGKFTSLVQLPVENVDKEPSSSGKPQKKSSAAPWFPFAAAAVIFLIAVCGMAIGTILQNKSLKGSCGGLASMPGSEGKSICELCTIPKDECTNAELREQMQAAAARDCAEESC